MIEKSYSREEVYQNALEYFNGDSLCADVWLNKYALKDSEGNIYEKSPDDMFKRLASELSRIENNYQNGYSYDEIYESLKEFKYIIPQGSPLAGIGNNFQFMTLSNCYVVGEGENDPDSYGGIMKRDQELAQLMKRRAGIGSSLSFIRPNESPVNNAAMTSTGVVPFMERYSNTTREVAQCIEENENVLTKNGLKKIKDICINEEVWTKEGWVKVVNKFNNEKDVYEVKTKRGYKIKTSLDHIFSILDNNNIKEEKLDNLKEGDKVNLLLGDANFDNDYVKLEKNEYLKSNYNNSNRLNEDIDLPDYLDEKLSYILGYLYGNGYVMKNNKGDDIGMSVSLPTNQKDIIDKFSLYFIDLFSYPLKGKKISDGDNYIVLRFHSKKIIKFLKDNNLLKEKAESIIFPNKIKQSPINIQSSFISGFFDADGYVSKSKKSYKFSTINYDFINDIRNILFSFGVVSREYIEDRSNIENWHDLFNISICGALSQERFVNLMTESIKVQDNRFIAKRDNVLTSYKLNDFGLKSSQYKYVYDNNKLLSVNAYQKVLKENEIEEFPNYLINDEIESIKYHSKSKTHDISLESEHFFWCNGFYVHNSGRRGALMLTINIEHPDVESFIDAKMEKGKVTGANVSVQITDKFMKAVKNNETFIQQFPINSNNPKITKEVSAKRLWDKIVNNTWSSAEPGLLMWDNILRESPADCYKDMGFRTTSTNPCSEIPLPDGDSCRLTAMNLYNFVKNPFTKDSFFDFDLFYKETHKGQKIMDNIINLEIEKINQIINKINNDPEDDETKRIELNLWMRIKDKCIKGRRTGLGITGLGDMLAALGYTYGTDEANKFADKVYMNLKHASYESSIDMAKDRGSFPIYDFQRETENPFLNRIKDERPELYEKMKKYGRRNIALLTTAPTGSISLLAKISSGVECAFMISYKRRRKINPNDKDSRVDFTDEIGDKWQEYHVFHHKFEDYLKIKGYDVEEVKEKYSKDEVNKLISESPYHNATTNDVNWVKKVEMQGMLQKHIDHSISVTVNLPKDVTVDKVKEVYQTAYDWGCKGVTIYRDGSRSGVLVSNEEKQEEKTKDALKDVHAPKRPKILEADVIRFNNNKEKWIAFVGLYNNRPYEIFTGKVDETEGLNISNSIEKGEIVKVKKGDPDGINSRYDFRYKDKDGYNITIEGISRTFEPEYWNYLKIVSSVLRHGMPLQYVYDMIERLNLNEESLNTWKKGVARVVKKYIPEGTKYGKCPQGEKDENCGLVFKEGCFSCEACGISRCG